MKFPDIEPGRVVEHDGDLFLIEDVIVEVTMQRIDTYRQEIERMADGEHFDAPSPVFTKVRGRLGEGQFAEDRFKPLYKEEEL